MLSQVVNYSLLTFSPFGSVNSTEVTLCNAGKSFLSFLSMLACIMHVWISFLQVLCSSFNSKGNIFVNYLTLLHPHPCLSCTFQCKTVYLVVFVFNPRITTTWETYFSRDLALTSYSSRARQLLRDPRRTVPAFGQNTVGFLLLQSCSRGFPQRVLNSWTTSFTSG